MADVSRRLTSSLSGMIERAESDPQVVGLILSGSTARAGMATERSDIDVWVVLDVPPAGHSSWMSLHSDDLDVAVINLRELRDVPGPERPDDWWQRWALAYADVLVDRTDGEVTRLVRAWGSYTEAEAQTVVGARLDGYVNWAYRSLKSHRDGHAFEARMDAVESLSWGLMVVFALHRRVRPYNKYLRWELTHHPLGVEGWVAEPWDSARLVTLLETILDDGSAAAQRELFALVERDVRAAGHGVTLDAWGDELLLLRP